MLGLPLQVSQPEDLSRDVIKSDTAEVYIEELDLRMSTGSLGGLITTVEGLLTSVQVPPVGRRDLDPSLWRSSCSGQLQKVGPGGDVRRQQHRLAGAV